jgi:hypothetical protein
VSAAVDISVPRAIFKALSSERRIYLQLDVLAQQLVPIPVEVAVHMAAVPPLAASGALLQGCHVLVRCAGVARRIVAALGILAYNLNSFLVIGH